MSSPPPPSDAPAGDRPVAWRRTAALVLLGVSCQVLQWICATSPERTESIYSQGVYPYVQRVLAWVSGLVPFSIAETILLGSVVFVAWRLLRGVRRWRTGTRHIGNLMAHAVAQTAGTLSVLFAVYQLLWGLNHARQPFAEHVGLELREVDSSQLARVVERLANRAAACRPVVLDLATDGRSILAPTWRDQITETYARAGREWPVLAGPRPPLRAPWISKLLTLASITGIYSPFTGEPHVNGDLPEILQPFVACHETAHLRGFAREDEANFIAWWVGSRATEPVITYSCELQAYRIALGRLYAVDAKMAMEVQGRIPEPVRRDAQRIREFWLGQPRVIHWTLSQVSKAANDAYLKSSGHADGVRSYGRMVDLLIAALGE